MWGYLDSPGILWEPLLYLQRALKRLDYLLAIDLIPASGINSILVTNLGNMNSLPLYSFCHLDCDIRSPNTKVESVIDPEPKHKDPK